MTSVADLIRHRRHEALTYAVAYPGHKGWLDSPEDANVIWLLSVGKSATSTTTNLLNLSTDVLAFHEVAPRLWSVGEQVWKAGCCEGWEHLLWACKRDVISVINGLGMVYAEFNHRLGYFAPAVERMTKGKAKYLFLIRDLDSHVPSAYSWGWYSAGSGNDIGRIHNPEYESRRQQIAWAWYEENKYYLDFLETIPQERRYFLPFSDIKSWNLGAIRGMFDRFGLSAPSDNDISDCLSLKSNANPDKLECEKNWSWFDRDAQRLMERAHSLRG